MSKERQSQSAEHSDDEHGGPSPQADSSRKRSSRACDQCRKTKSKCERFEGDTEPCKSCSLAGVACTFLGPSFKRGPPKGYIHAIEQRWHQVESILGAILNSPDPQVQALIDNIKTDDLARDILNRVDAGPFGPTGRLNHSVAVTKEDFFASIMNSAEAAQTRDPSRPRRQSRMSREIVSSSNSALVSPTLEWQDRLSSHFARIGPVSRDRSVDVGGMPYSQRRRLDGDRPSPGQPDWDRMYRLDKQSSDTEEEEATNGLGQLSLDENKELRYHGFSSGLHLLTKANPQRPDRRNSGGIWNLPMARVWPPAANQFIPEDSVDVEMPPVAVQRHLLELYFTYVHIQLPTVHKTLFWAEFDAMHAPSQPPMAQRGDRPVISKLLLLSMFATAARYDSCNEEPAPGTIWEAGLDYMVRAREVLNRVYHYCRPTTCQALILLGMREFGIGQMEHGWLYTGMGLRMAIDLGLHRDSSHWKQNGREIFTPMEVQARRQLWWACQKADKYSAVYMGRPPQLSEATYDTPLPEIDSDEPWAPHPSDPLSVNFTPVPGHVMACYREASSQMVIFGEILERIYPVRPVAQSVKRVALSDLEGRLDRWYTGLPDHLMFDAASSRFMPSPSVMMLHVKYWNCVLVLHRAFIPKWRPEGHPRAGVPQDTLALKSFDICQSAATHMTNIIDAYQRTYTLTRASMLVVQHLFAAGIMHVVTLTMRPSNMQTSVALGRVLSHLKEMSVRWPAGQRAWELISGAHTHVSDPTFPSMPINGQNRQKRAADDAFGLGDKVSDVLQQEAFEERTGGGTGTPQPVRGGPASDRVLAHMLGLDIPGIEPSTSYLPGYQWWPRGQAPNGQPQPGPSQQQMQPMVNGISNGIHSGQGQDTPSPHSTNSNGGGTHSPPNSMPIPFSFDVAQNFWSTQMQDPMQQQMRPPSGHDAYGVGGVYATHPHA